MNNSVTCFLLILLNESIICEEVETILINRYYPFSHLFQYPGPRGGSCWIVR